VKLSIIIPVYRVEATLSRCLESVTAQMDSDWEVILVDDGSPDQCPRLCDEWARRDARIRVIHKANGGLSDARNAGLDAARGELIAFADSDDEVGDGTYREALQAMTADVDMVEFPVRRFCGSPHEQTLTFRPAVYTDAAVYWLQGRAYEHTYAWNKIYRRCLFEGVRFPVGRVFEDVWTLPLLLARARRVATTDKGLYHYYYNPQGITVTAQAPQLQQLLDAHREVIGRWCDTRYYLHVVNIQMDVANLTGAAPTLPRRHAPVLTPGLTATERLKALLLNTLGINRLCKLNKILHRWKKPRHL